MLLKEAECQSSALTVMGMNCYLLFIACSVFPDSILKFIPLVPYLKTGTLKCDMLDSKLEIFVAGKRSQIALLHAVCSSYVTDDLAVVAMII